MSTSWEVYKKNAPKEREIGLSTLSREALMKELFQRETAEMFPLHVYPVELHHYIQELTERMHIPKEFVGLFLMAAGGAAMGSYYMAEAHSQRTYPAVWGCAIGESSSGKTFAMDQLFEPFEALELEYMQDNLDDYDDRKRSADVQNQSVDYSDFEEKQIIFKKGTFPAFLQKALKSNPKGVILYKEELVTLMAEFNKKNNEDFEPFLLEDDQSFQRSRAVLHHEFAAHAGGPEELGDDVEDLLHDLRREADPQDRRRKLLYVTSAGAQALERMNTAVEAAQKHMLAPLSAADQKVFLHLLAQLVAGHEASEEGAQP